MDFQIIISFFVLVFQFKKPNFFKIPKTKWYLSCLIRFQTVEFEKIEENLIDISSQ